ncbi:hypothetical protein LXA43DRAFT_31912 [Ganoderma leucocontextum]|nr:hypothetical protein LXA43DRAFT_31912 [Ganoderma leucocontextum]
MSLIDSYLNSSVFDHVDAMDSNLTTTTTTQVEEPVSPWSASLPPNILGRIFVDVHDMTLSYHPKRQSAWLWLTRVCRAWRQLALDTPALWTHLRMYDINYPGELEELLSRSDDQLVHLELNFVKSPTLSAVEFDICIMLAVGVHGHRIASFDVFCFSEDVTPIQRLHPMLVFPNGMQVSLEPRTSRPRSVLHLCGTFPRLSDLPQVAVDHPDASRVFHSVRKARRHDPTDHVFRQAFGLRIPLVLHDLSALTHLYLEYCGSREKEGSVMQNIVLPPTFRKLAIKDEPWEMQTLLSHISFNCDAKRCANMCIKLAVDLHNPVYRSQRALQDLIHAIQWPSIYYHVSVCSTVFLRLTSDYTLTLAGFNGEGHGKFQFEFFNGGGDGGAILELAADTLNNYQKIFAPPDAPWFSNTRQLSVHDATGELGRLLDWDALVSCLPLHVRSISVGNARVVAEFLRAMDRLADQAACRSAARPETQTLRLSRLVWCVDDLSPRQLTQDVAVVQRCHALGILDVEEVVLRVAREADSDASLTLIDQFSPLPSPPTSSEDSASEDEETPSRARIRVRVDDDGCCSTCHSPQLPSKDLVQESDVEPDLSGDPRASSSATAMDAWENFAGGWEDHIWNMAASYNDADWMYMSAS